jgi:hypothetical protein
MARDAIVRHIRGLIKDGAEIPEEPLAKKRPLVESRSQSDEWPELTES